LASFLDDWSLKLGLDNPSVPRIRSLAQALDPDAWRGKLRVALPQGKDSGSRAALIDLATRTDVLAQSATTVTLLAAALRRVGEAESATKLLGQAQILHPSDAWIHWELGHARKSLRPPAVEDAVRSFTAAAALKPEMHHAFAWALHDTGRRDEGFAV